jgi:hypothetical protein
MSAQVLHDKAKLCFRLARQATACDARETLWSFAMSYEEEARLLECRQKHPPRRRDIPDRET